MDVPLPLLDHEIERAVAESRAARLELTDGAEPAPPLEIHRRVSSRSTWLELGELAGADPLAAAERDWVHLLTLERVLWSDRVRVATAWREPTIAMRDPESVRISPFEARRRLLREPVVARRRAWGDALARGSGALADAVRVLAERTAQAGGQLDAASTERLELPADPPEAIAAAASRLLDATAPLHERAGAWPDALGAALGRDAAAGWPAHLGARWLEDVFRGTGLCDGLELRVGALPEPLGAASFARALAGLGAAIAAADAPPSAPFCMAHPPFDLRAARRAGLFASLAADPLFGRRVLGLGRDASREQAGRVARALLVSLRLDAARVLLRGGLLLSPRERPERFEEVTARALGAPIPPSLAGVLPMLSAHDATRFAGTVLAASDRRSLIERFDEDWFKNPAAARALREEDAVLPASTRTTAEALEAGRDALVSVASALMS